MPKVIFKHQGVEQEIEKSDLDAYLNANPGERKNVQILGMVNEPAPRPVNVNTGRQDYSSPIGRPPPHVGGPLLWEKGQYVPSLNALDAEARVKAGAERAFGPVEALAVNGLNAATFDAGSRLSPDYKAYTERIERDRPVLGAVGRLAGSAAVAPLMPGAAPAKVSEATWGAIGRQGAKMTAGQMGAAALSASNRADPGKRWQAAGEAAASTAATAPLNILAAPFTLRTPAGKAATIENTPELGINTPTSWLNPESYKNAAAAARISSLRTTPSEAADVAAQYMGGSGNPAQGLVNFGREINAAKINGSPVFRADNAGQLVEKAAADKVRSGSIISGMEQRAEQAGNLPNTGAALRRARQVGTDTLGENPIDAGKRVGPFDSGVGAVENRLAGGARLDHTSIKDAKDAVRWLREAANRKGGFVAEAADPDAAQAAKQLGAGSAILNDEIEGQVARTVGPDIDKYRTAKDRYGLMSRVEEMANPHRSAVAAPFSLSSVLEGGALAQTAAAMGAGPGTVITMRQAGRLLGRQGNVNPARADRLSRLAEGVEGEGISPGWRVAGAGVRAAQQIPGTAGFATAAGAGRDIAQTLNDPNYRPDPLTNTRAWAAKKWLEQFYNSPAKE